MVSLSGEANQRNWALEDWKGGLLCFLPKVVVPHWNHRVGDMPHWIEKDCLLAPSRNCCYLLLAVHYSFHRRFRWCPILPTRGKPPASHRLPRDSGRTNASPTFFGGCGYRDNGCWNRTLRSELRGIVGSRLGWDTAASMWWGPCASPSAVSVEPFFSSWMEILSQRIFQFRMMMILLVMCRGTSLETFPEHFSHRRR